MITTSSQFTSLEVHLSWGFGRHLSLRRPARSLSRGLVLMGRTKSAESGGPARERRGPVENPVPPGQGGEPGTLGTRSDGIRNAFGLARSVEALAFSL